MKSHHVFDVPASTHWLLTRMYDQFLSYGIVPLIHGPAVNCVGETHLVHWVHAMLSLSAAAFPVCMRLSQPLNADMMSH